MVHADTYGSMVGFTEVNEGNERVFDSLKLMLIFLVGELDFDECAPRVDEIAGIDSHLLHFSSRGVGGFGVEVYVGDEGGGEASLPELFADKAQAVGLDNALGGKTHIFTPGLDNACCLCGRGINVAGGGGGH